MALKHVWQRLRDGIRFAWAKSSFDFVPLGQVSNFHFSDCHHIIVLKLDGKLGDTQVMSHFYSALREHNPRLFLSVVCSSNLAEIYKDVLGFDQVLTASRKPKFKEIKALCDELKAAAPVGGIGAKEGGVDLVITTEPNFRPRDFYFNHLLQPRFVAGCDTRVNCVNILLYDPKIKTKQVAECFIDFMKQGHLDFAPLAYTRLVTPSSLQNMSKWLEVPVALEGETAVKEQGDARFILAINPRASSYSRSFRDDFVITLMQDLQGKFGTIASARDGAQGPEERNSISKMHTEAVTSPTVGGQTSDVQVEQKGCATRDGVKSALEFLILVPPQADELKTKLKATAANCGAAIKFLPDNSTALDLSTAIDLCDALITVDTAAVHMACASGKHQLCVYTGTDINESLRWAPIGDKAQVVRFEGQTVPEISDEVLLNLARDFLEKQLQEQ